MDNWSAPIPKWCHPDSMCKPMHQLPFLSEHPPELATQTPLVVMSTTTMFSAASWEVLSWEDPVSLQLATLQEVAGKWPFPPSAQEKEHSIRT